MEPLILVAPSADFSAQIASYRQEFLDEGGSMDGTGSLRSTPDPADWLAQVEALRCEETTPVNWVPSTQFLGVRPSERRKGFAAQMLRLCLPRCRELGLTRVLITCLRENEASRRTILANGGVYESTVYEPREGEHLERYWIDLGRAH